MNRIAPIRKHFALLTILLYTFKKLLDRMSHIDGRQFTMIVRHGPNASKLQKGRISDGRMSSNITRESSYIFQHLRQWTTTTISISKD